MPPSETDRAVPRALDYAAVFFTSSGVLAFEIVLLRVLSRSQWNHFAELAVTLALMGFGVAGTVLALLGPRAAMGGERFFAGAALFAGLAVGLAFAGNQAISVRPLFALWDFRELSRLIGLNLLAFLPFLAAAIALGQVFLRWPDHAGPLYASNMTGSAAGGLIAAWLLDRFALQTAFLAPALVFFAAPAVLFLARRETRGLAAFTWLLLLALAGVMATHRVPPLFTSDFKPISYYLDLPDARVVERRPSLHGSLTRIASDSIRIAPGLSLKWREAPPSQDVLVVEASRAIALLEEPPEQADFLRARLAWAPFHLRQAPSVLILGTSEMPAYYSARRAGCRRIEWIEPHPGIARAFREQYGADAVRRDSPRGFLERSPDRFDVIFLDYLTNEAGALDGEPLVTVEGLKTVLRRLTPEGMAVFPLSISRPPRRFPRLLATLERAMDESGVNDPTNRLAILRTLHELQVCVFARPIAPEEAAAVRDFSDRWGFDPVWLPDIREEEPNRRHRLPAPVFHRWTRHVFAGAPAPAGSDFFSRAPACDHRPFFWKSLRWSGVAPLLREWGKQGLALLDWGPLAMLASMAATLVFAFLLILLPLFLRFGASDVRGGRGFLIAYFAALGLGYLVIEIVFLRRVMLLAGDPVLGAVVVVPAFLAGSGLGALRTPATRVSLRLFLPLVAGLAAAWVALGWLEEPVWRLGQPWLRALVPVLLMAPVFWLMGQPFPLGLRALGSDRQVAWAWGINGFASVAAGPAAILLAAETGFHIAWRAGVACYLVAWFAYRRWAGSRG